MRSTAAIPTALVLLAIAACSSGSSPGHAKPKTSPTTPAAASAGLSISPANGAKNAAPDQGIAVTASHGKIGHVTVTAAGGQVTGSVTNGGTQWHSQWALGVSQHYTVTATATNPAGKIVTATSSFTTLTPRQTFTTEIFEGSNQTYGVGMPIKLTFSRAITDKAAVERALQVTTSKPVVGAWDWQGDQTLDFRPQSYWPTGTKISFTGHLDGVQGAPGVYGYHTLTQSY
ncbi:MAG TPA: Ig-like domain-containing protein, partial [Pseudonocardiaceae bacterium]|nr:Ig-like domain-containing protein [Pseudonocardiaceae bacterium]